MAFLYINTCRFRVDMPNGQNKIRKTRSSKSTVTEEERGKGPKQRKKNNPRRERTKSTRTRIRFDLIGKVNELKNAFPGQHAKIEEVMFPSFHAQERDFENYYYHEFVKSVGEGADKHEQFVVTRHMKVWNSELADTTTKIGQIVVESNVHNVGLLKEVFEFAEKKKKRVTIDPVGLCIRVTRDVDRRLSGSKSTKKSTLEDLKNLITTHAARIDVDFERIVEILYLVNNPKHFGEQRNSDYKDLLLHIYKEVARQQPHDIHIRAIESDEFPNHSNILHDLHDILRDINHGASIVVWGYKTPDKEFAKQFLTEELRSMASRMPLAARKQAGGTKDRGHKEGNGPRVIYANYGHQKANAVPIESLEEN